MATRWPQIIATLPHTPLQCFPFWSSRRAVITYIVAEVLRDWPWYVAQLLSVDDQHLHGPGRRLIEATPGTRGLCLRPTWHMFACQVLATAASNIAVDNLVERLAAADARLQLVRTGHAARLLPSVCRLAVHLHLVGIGLGYMLGNPKLSQYVTWLGLAPVQGDASI